MSNRTLAIETTNAVGKTVTLKGWVHVRRNLGKLIFIDLRDGSGIVQVVFSPDFPQAHTTADQLRAEFVIAVSGNVVERKKKNPNLPTGEVELVAEQLTILNASETPPFEVDADTKDVKEELRLEYRYLDLRSNRLQKNLRNRSRLAHFCRQWLDSRGFVEIETPVLTKDSPEGAREYVVPSRLYPGKFYSLPQAPQTFKQLLMVAGFEKYYQFARCYRDEDERGDRQPEHTQLDLEMSFVEPADVWQLMEELLTAMLTEVYPGKRIAQAPWPRMSYDEVMKKFKTDRPDLRKDSENADELAFCWITDFPLFEQAADGKLTFAHNPFTRPHDEDIPLLDTDPLQARSFQYDLVLNGVELASGSIRNHEAKLQRKIFSLLGNSEAQIEEKFGAFLKALTYGAPPHGGIAPGLDRLMMVLENEPNIREVMAFPKTTDAKDLMLGAPSELSDEQLKDVHIQVKK